MLIFQNYIKLLLLQIIEGWVCIVEAIDANDSKDVLGYHVEVLICVVEAIDESKSVLGYPVEVVIMFYFILFFSSILVIMFAVMNWSMPHLFKGIVAQPPLSPI